MRFYIVDTMDGMVRGTDDKTIADDFAASDDFFVIDSKEDRWLKTDGTAEKIKRYR
jgi:hypothetical protein